MSAYGAISSFIPFTVSKMERWALMQLHPVTDGLIPEPYERGVTHRDKGGNRLVDVVSPDSGYCVGVRSPLTVAATVVTASPISGGKGKPGEDVRIMPAGTIDADRTIYYDLIRSRDTDPVGLVCRTTEDGDDLLPVSRVRVIQSTKSVSRGSATKSVGTVRRTVSARKANDAAVKAVLASLSYTGPITPEIRSTVLEMIALERAVTGR